MDYQNKLEYLHNLCITNNISGIKQYLIDNSQSNAKELLEIELDGYIYKDTYYFCGTPLQIACTYGYTNLIKFLLINNININYPNGRPLYIACYNNNYDLVKVLINNGVDCSSYNAYTSCSLVLINHGNLHITKLLVQNGFQFYIHVENLYRLYKKYIDNIIIEHDLKAFIYIIQNVDMMLIDEEINQLYNKKILSRVLPSIYNNKRYNLYDINYNIIPTNFIHNHIILLRNIHTDIQLMFDLLENITGNIDQIYSIYDTTFLGKKSDKSL